MQDFHEESVAGEMNELVEGKTIVSVNLDHGMYDYFIMRFTDGSELRLRYDYIYEWEVA